MITAIDVAWAAGFIEGEGTFASSGRGGVSLLVHQVQREPLDRLQKLFGGRVRETFYAGSLIHRWGVHGMPAAAATMSVYSLLSPRRREQAGKLLDRWKLSPGHRNTQKTHCPQGHAYTQDNIYRHSGSPKWRICRACAIERTKLRYAKSKLANT